MRLTQGDFRQETVYGDDPLEVARHWVGQGATHIHVVDLDGAKTGIPANRELVIDIASQIDATIQVGGGLRDVDIIARYLEHVDRVVVGTAAITNELAFRNICERFSDQVVLGIDSRDGLVATDGWLEISAVAATELATRFASSPLAGIVYTDIAVDGTLAGPNLEAMQKMAEVASCPLIASGGVRDRTHIEALARLGVAGVILGRSLYENTLSLSDALAAAAAVQAS